MSRYSILFLFVCGISCHAWAQNISFVAAPEASKMGVNDAVQVSFTISNLNDLRDIRPTSFGDFTILQGPFQSQEMTVNNGKVSRNISLTYLLKPRREGNLTIPPAVATDAAGHTYQSNAVTIQVVPGSLAPQRRTQPRSQPDDDILAMMQQMDQQMQQAMRQNQSQTRRMGLPQAQRLQPPAPPQQPTAEDLKKDLFIKILIDKTKVHLGEQVTATYKIYAKEPVNMNVSNISILKMPQLIGFWTQYFKLPPEPKPMEEVVDGKKYKVLTFEKCALFPQQTGTLTIDPFQIRCVIQKMVRRGYDFFGRPVDMLDIPRPIEMESPSDKIIVAALPEKDKPAEFSGAVGNFTITDKLDKQEITTDNIATLTVNITGSGNIKLVEPPKFELPNGISTYDPQIIDTITSRTTTIAGSKMLTYAITPHTPGDYAIPALTFSYFNPQTGKYVTERTQPLKLHVSQGKNYSPAVASSNMAAPLKDIHDISKQPLAKLSPANKPLLFKTGYWSVYSLPVLAFIALIGWKRKDEELSKDTVRQKSKRANKIALQRLVTAKKLLQQESKIPFYEEVSKAIWLYLSDKMNIPLSALSRDAARAAMNTRKVPDHLRKQLEDVIWECETALYASGGSKQMSHTYEDAVKVISDLEDSFKA